MNEIKKSDEKLSEVTEKYRCTPFTRRNPQRRKRNENNTAKVSSSLFERNA